MALGHVTHRGNIFIPGGFVGDRRALSLSGTVRTLHGAFFTALGWLVLGSIFSLTFVIFAIGIALAGWFPSLFSFPNSKAASVSRRTDFTRR